MNRFIIKIFFLFFASLTTLFVWGVINVLGRPNAFTNVLLSIISFFVIVYFIYKFTTGQLFQIWIVIFIFVLVVGYYYKTYLAFYTLNSGESLETLNPEWRDYDWSTVTYGLEVTTASLLAFSFIIIIIFSTLNFKFHNNIRKSLSIVNIEYLTPILLFSTFISVLLFYLRSNLGIGQMGFENIRLPFGLDTIIFRMQSLFIPLLLLFLIFAYNKIKKIPLRNLSILLLINHYILLSISSLSKAGFAFGVLSIFLLFFLMGAITRRMNYLLVLGAIFGVLFYQFGWTIRGAALAGDLANYSAIEIIIKTIKDFTEAPFKIIQEIALRITGADGLWQTRPQASVFPEQSMLNNIVERGIIDVYTRDIVGVTWAFDFREPGIIATFMLIGGGIGFPFLLLLFIFGFGKLWKHLERTNAAPVICTYTAISFLTLTTSGAFSLTELASYIFGLIFYLILCKLFVSKRIFECIPIVDGKT